MIDYTDGEVREALDSYRDKIRPIMYENAFDGPSETVAVAAEDYAFVWSITADEGDGGTVAGRVAERFFVSKEFFDYAGGEIPDDRELYQHWIECITEVEDDPFTFIALDEKAADEITARYDEVREDGQYTILETDKTAFFYREQLLD